LDFSLSVDQVRQGKVWMAWVAAGGLICMWRREPRHLRAARRAQLFHCCFLRPSTAPPGKKPYRRPSGHCHTCFLFN